MLLTHFEGQGVLFMIINVNELASLFSDIGSWIGNKLFNNPGYQSQRQSAYKNPSAYSRSVDSFNKAKATSSASKSSGGKSGFFGGSSSSSSSSSSSFGG